MKRGLGVIFFLFFILIKIYGQPGQPAPIDGGLGILIAAGILFGASCLKKKKEK